MSEIYNYDLFKSRKGHLFDIEEVDVFCINQLALGAGASAALVFPLANSVIQGYSISHNVDMTVEANSIDFLLAGLLLGATIIDVSKVPNIYSDPKEIEINTYSKNTIFGGWPEVYVGILTNSSAAACNVQLAMKCVYLEDFDIVYGGS